MQFQNISRYYSENPKALFFLICFFAIACLPRLLSLDSHWSSDETRWLRRSETFIASVKQGKFEKTLQAYHPGVTTMWAAGFRKYIKKTYTWVSVRELARSRWLIGITLIGGLVGTGYLFHRLFDVETTCFVFFFLTVDPFLLSETRRVHTDALAATFILLTVLLFLLYCLRDTQKHSPSCNLIFSGIAFGLACLSKSYALILLPWLPLTLWIFRTSGMSWREHLYRSFVTGVFFLNWSLLTVFIVWPLFWHPLALSLGGCLLGATLLAQRSIQRERHVWVAVGTATLMLLVCIGYGCQKFWRVLDSVGWALTTAHEIDHFFLGNIIADPGWLFYLFTLSMKSTPFVLPLAIFAILFLWKHRHNTSTATHLKIALAIGAVALLFTVFLSVTSKKFARYLLPAFPMLDILAAMGLFYLTKWGGALLKKHTLRKVAQTCCIALVLLLTVVPVLALHPYYGTYYNLCWKGTDITKIITVGEASGLDIAAAYLNKKPNAPMMSIQCSDLGAEFLRYYFKGTVYRSDQNLVSGTKKLRPADYEVVYIRDSQIGRVPQSGTRNGKLEHTITLNGIDHVWIYRIEKS